MRFVILPLVSAALAVCVATQTPTPELPVNPQTNAERFAVGLPPLPPKHRHRNHSLNRGSKADTARRAMASPSPPISTRCNIVVKRAKDESFLAYAAASGPSTIKYGALQSGQAGALEITFSISLDDPSSLCGLDLFTLNGLHALYPYFGVVTANWPVTDLNPGVLRYFYIGGTAQTPKGSPPILAGNTYGSTSKVESAIWTFNPATQAITPQWVNSDGSSPVTYLAYAAGAFFVTGDIDRLISSVAGAQEVKFFCAPIVA